MNKRELGSTTPYAHLYAFGYDPENADTKKLAYENLSAEEKLHIENINFRIIGALHKNNKEILPDNRDLLTLKKLNHLIGLLIKAHDNFTELASYQKVKSIIIQWSLGNKPTKRDLIIMNGVYECFKEYDIAPI